MSFSTTEPVMFNFDSLTPYHLSDFVTTKLKEIEVTLLVYRDRF